MNYFVGIVLCMTTVLAEAIPDALTLDPVQNFLYQVACRTSVALKDKHVLPTPSSLNPKVESASPAVPEGVPKVAPTPVPAPLKPKAPEVKPAAPTVPEGVPKVLPIPLVKPAEPTVPDRVPPLASPEIEAAKARAIVLYGKESGFLGVTDRIMSTRDGQRFLYINIKGDGNCGFYAIGVDRARFVATIEGLVNEQHDVFQSFVNRRDGLALDLRTLRSSSDLTAIAARVQAIARSADNGGDVAPALKLLTQFATEKKPYHVELFIETRNRLIKNLQDLQELQAVRLNSDLGARIETFINDMVAASVDDVNVDVLREKRNALVSSLTQVGVAVASINKVQAALNELMEVCGYSDLNLFEKGKLQLINKIENLTTLSSYEAFLTALRQELMTSGVTADDLATKEKVLRGVRTVFSMNRGYATWFPGGLFGAIKDRLGVEYNIWAMESGDVIKMFSGSGRRGAPAKGQNVRNVFFTGFHYDMLIPLDD
ncbi:MAG: hypothetical protein Q8Q56_04570 [Alphaproteobacteria bacterium]|nr:hypothetical protein [Alphaproteobacteria bacterium]